MVLTAFATLAIALCAMLPGVVLLRNHAAQAGMLAAGAAASLAAMQLLAALVGLVSDIAGLGGVPALALVPVSILATLAAAWATRAENWRWSGARPDWQAVVFAALLVASGIYTLDIAFGHAPDGALLVHAWYNADWFKHMGHVHALADYGMPARDIFGNGNPLRYYWLSYVLPGAATAAAGDGWVALATTNAVVTWLFSHVFYGLIRSVGPGPMMALGLAVLGTITISPMIYAFDLIGGVPYSELVTYGEAPGPTLLIIPQVIPQHALALTLFLAWALLHRPGSDALTGARWLALAALAALMTISTLLGAMLLAAYGLTVLWHRRWQSLGELVAMAIVSGLLVLLLGVLDLGSGETPIDSPLFTNAPEGTAFDRVLDGIVRLFGTGGAALVGALFLVRYWKPEAEPERFLKTMSLALIAAAFICTILTEALAPPRIASELVIRARLVFALGVVVIGSWAIPRWWAQGGRPQTWTAGVIVLLLALSLPAAVIRTQWYGNLGDSQTTRIPADDLRALAALRADSRPRDKVWQYPEPPYFSVPSGADSWAAIFAGRTVANSLRATEFGAAEPYITLSTAFFAGDPVIVPAEMDWVYLSRALHPASYDALLARMTRDQAWQRRACYPGACVFSRRSANP